MFTHRIQIQLKTDSFILLSRKIETTIMPLLRLQKGFSHGLTTVAPERSTAVEDTLWLTREDAEAYHQTGYPEVVKALSEVVAAPPTATIFDDPDSSGR